MGPDAQRALERLRDPGGAALAVLARMVVDEAIETPITRIAHPRWLSGQIAAALEAMFRGEAVRDRLAKALDEQLEIWRTETRPLGEFLPEEVEAPLHDALRKPWVPSEEVVFRFLDHQVLQGLMREVLEGAITRFREGVTRIDKGVFGGMAGRAARKGRGLLGGMADNFGPLGGVADNLVGAVKGEVEFQFERRVQEFLDRATTEGLRVVARHISNPAHAKAYGELRISTLHVIQGTQVKTLGAEIEKLGAMDYVDILVRALRSQLDDPEFVPRTEDRIRRLLEETGEGTFGSWLDEVHLRDVWTESTSELVAQRLQAVVRTDRFEAWWGSLFEP